MFLFRMGWPPVVWFRDYVGGGRAQLSSSLNFSMVCIVPAAYLMAPKRYSDEDCLGILRQVEVALAGRAVAA